MPASHCRSGGLDLLLPVALLAICAKIAGVNIYLANYKYAMVNQNPRPL